MKVREPEDYDYCEAYGYVCENIHHQFTFYPAMFLVTPYLVKLFEAQELADNIGYQIDIIIEIGILVMLENRWEYDPIEVEVMESYLESVDIIRTKAKKLIKENLQELKEWDTQTLRQLCTAILALLGDTDGAYLLMTTDWDEVGILCEHCGYYEEEVILDEEEIKQKVTPAQLVNKEWDEEPNKDIYLCIGNIANSLELEEEKEILSYCYGTFTCPQCGNTRHLMHFIKSYYFGVEGGSYRMDWGE